MLKVKTYLKKSEIHGLGVFAGEPIKKGSIVWEFDPQHDLCLSPAEALHFSAEKKAYLEHYGYVSPVSGLWIICRDDAKFMNHSNNPNTAGLYPEHNSEGIDIATRDILEGEEITCDYDSFDKRLTRLHKKP